MKYLVADWGEFISPASVRYEDGGRTVGQDWQIFDYYEDAKDYARSRLNKMDNPAISFVIVPLDVSDTNMERVTLPDQER